MLELGVAVVAEHQGGRALLVDAAVEKEIKVGEAERVEADVACNGQAVCVRTRVCCHCERGKAIVGKGGSARARKAGAAHFAGRAGAR